MCCLHWKNVSCEYLSLFFCSFTLCSATAIALQIVFSNKFALKYYKIGDVRFSERTDDWCTFSWNVCNKNGYVIRCTQTAVSKVVTAYTYHEKASSAKWDSGWKLKLSGKDHCILTGLSKSYSTAAKVTAVLNIHLKDLVSEKKKNSLTTASQMQSMVQLQLQNLWLLNTTLKVKKLYDGHKAWMSDAGNT